MKALAVVLAALVVAGPAAAAGRDVLFGDAFSLETRDAGPFERLPDGRLTCLSEACAGKTVVVGGVAIRVVGRVRPDQVAARTPPYRAPTDVVTRGRVSLAQGLLFAGALAAALAAVGLALTELGRRRAEMPGDRLLRALRLVRESAARDPLDRRRALDHLADTLGDAPPAAAATALAWGRPEPASERTRALADEVAQ